MNISQHYVEYLERVEYVDIILPVNILGARFCFFLVISRGTARQHSLP